MKLVVLDRDGVINRDSSAYIKGPGEWEPLPGSLDAIARLTARGFTVVVCTNQSGLARGLFDTADLARIHGRMDSAVRAAGGRLSGIYVCPHGPDDGCRCRKPESGLLEAVGRRLGVSLAGVPVIGDSARDLEAARRAGARPILVLTGNGRRTLAAGNAAGVEHYADLSAAVDQLIEEAGNVDSEAP